VVAGYDPVMPTFQGQVTEEQLSQLIAYVRSLGPVGSAAAGGTGGTAPAGTTASNAQMDANSPLNTAGQTKGAAQKPPQK
jgi:cytochrome c oxidase subunit 2